MNIIDLQDPAPIFLTVEQVAGRWSNKFNIGADYKYVLDCYPELTFYEFTLAGLPIMYSREKTIQENLEYLEETAGQSLSTLFEHSDFISKLPEYEKKNIKVRRDDLLLFEISFKTADLNKMRESIQKSEVEAIEVVKQRKKLKPKLRDTTESLMLIYDLAEKYKVEYRDELPGPAAWAKIVSKEFTSEFIKEVSDAKKSITLASGKKLEESNFLDNYRRRFD